MFYSHLVLFIKTAAALLLTQDQAGLGKHHLVSNPGFHQISFHLAMKTPSSDLPSPGEVQKEGDPCRILLLSLTDRTLLS